MRDRVCRAPGRRWWIAAVIIGAALLGAAGAAAAHGGAGEITLVAADPVGPDELTVVVDVSYLNDGHAAEVGSLTVEAVGVGGAVLAPHEPFRPTDVEGRYAAIVTFPAAGSWDVTITSTFPPGRLDVTLEVASDAPGGPLGDPADDGPGDGPAGDTTGDDEARPGDEPGDGSDLEVDAVTEVEAVAEVEASEAGGGVAPIVVVAVVVAALAALGTAVVLRRR